MNSLKELISRVEELRAYTNPKDVKFDTDPSVYQDGWILIYSGAELIIEWEQLDEKDHGNVFLLPGHEEPHVRDALLDEGIVHIPYPAGGQKCAEESEWVMLRDLVTNPLVKKISFPDGDGDIVTLYDRDI